MGAHRDGICYVEWSLDAPNSPDRLPSMRTGDPLDDRDAPI